MGDVMSIEYLGAKIFLDEINQTEQLWVARNEFRKIYAVEIEQHNFSLPVWSDSDKVSEYLTNARLIGPPYQPHAIPLAEFTLTWLSDPARAIAELQINPDGKSSRVLVMTKEEFQAEQLPA